MGKLIWKQLIETIDAQAGFKKVRVILRAEDYLELYSVLPAGNVWIAENDLIVSDGSFELRISEHGNVEQGSGKNDFVLQKEGMVVSLMFE